MRTLADRLRESSHERWFTDSALLQEAADELERLAALEAERVAEAARMPSKRRNPVSR